MPSLLYPLILDMYTSSNYFSSVFPHYYHQYAICEQLPQYPQGFCIYMSTSMSYEERMASSSYHHHDTNNDISFKVHKEHGYHNNDNTSIIEHPTTVSPKWLVIRLHPQSIIINNIITSSSSYKYQINLSWRDKTPIRKIFTFLRRSLPQSDLSNQKLYLSYNGQILAYEDIMYNDIILQQSLGDEFTKAVTRPIQLTLGAHQDSAVICTVAYGFIKENHRDIAIQTEGGLDVTPYIDKSTMTVFDDEGVTVNKGVQVDVEHHRQQQQQLDKSNNDPVETVKHESKKKNKGKKGDDKKNEQPQKRKRRSRKGDGKGVKKLRKTNDTPSGETDIVKETNRKERLVIEEAKNSSPTSIIEEPPCVSQKEMVDQCDGDDKANDKSECDGDKGDTIEDTIKGDIEDEHLEGVDILEAISHNPLTHIICHHIPEDEPIEVDYGGEEEEEEEGEGVVTMDVEDDKSITFEEPPNGEDLLEDEDDGEGYDTQALEQDHNEGTDDDIVGAANKQSLILRPRPRPLSLSSIISDCRPIEDDEDRAEMETSAPISAGDLEGVVITPSEHPPQTTRGAPDDSITTQQDEKDTLEPSDDSGRYKKVEDNEFRGSTRPTHEYCCNFDYYAADKKRRRAALAMGLMNDSYSGPGQNYLQVRASVIAQGRG